MNKVMQTVTGYGGNCESATIATLLGLSIEDVPSFWEGIDAITLNNEGQGEAYQANLNRFLKTKGLTSISLGVAGEPSESDINWVISISKALGVKHLVSGISPRGHNHSVIYENGELWHDPHPEGGGVIPSQVTFIVPIFGETNV